MSNWQQHDDSWMAHERESKSERFWRGVRETIALTVAITVLLWIG